MRFIEKFRSAKFGVTYEADDGSGVLINTDGPLPALVPGLLIGEITIACAPTVGLTIAALTLMKLVTSATRPSVVMALYRHDDPELPGIVITTHAAKSRFYFCDQMGITATIEAAVRLLDDEALWTILRALTGTRDSAYVFGKGETEREWREAFIENRLRKHRKPTEQIPRVWINPRPEDKASMTDDLALDRQRYKSVRYLGRSAVGLGMP